ncbi:MAG: dimethylaniline monooxygenase (N-oxide forming) [Motiliproteus sp.]|jgi:dimethylaniline monooxygenase (N-oxide forming)
MNIMFDCLVIGAGPSGIVTVKECIENGLTNTLAIEQGPGIGGNFIRSYDKLTLTSSCTISMFSDFWIGEGYEKAFWTKKEVVDYWERYAEHFKISDKFRFNTTVTSAELTDKNQWEIKLDNGQVYQAKRLVVAVGASNFPSLPAWNEELRDVSWMHSKDYRNPLSFKGKNVVVVGGGESAAEIALEVAKVANHSWISLRSSSGWISPRFRGENPADLSTNRVFWGLPRQFGNKAAEAIIRFDKSRKDPVYETIAELNTRLVDSKGPFGTFGTKTTALAEAIALHKSQIVGEISNVKNGGRTLITADGQTLENVDAIIFCTGYKNTVPFFSRELATVGNDPRNLFKQMFDSNLRESLCWVGTARPCFGSQFPLMEMQARYCGLVFSGKLKLPDSVTMQEVTIKNKTCYLENLGHSAERVTALVDYHIYLDDMAKLIGCAPPLWKYLFLHPTLWLRMVFGPTQATQFRLKGLNSKNNLAQEIIKKIPLGGFTHIIKLAIRGRIYYFFKKILTFKNQSEQ